MKIQSLRNQSGAAHLALIIVAVLLVVGGIGAYILTNGSKNNGGLTSLNPFTSKSATTSTEIKAMILDAKAGKSKVSCDYTDDSGKASAIYIAGSDKMRVDTTINKNPGHMLWLGDKAYIWADGNNKGSYLPATKSSDTTSAQTDKFANDVAKYKMSCRTVSKLDDSIFKLPENVTFTDFNSQLNSTSHSTSSN